tara:strand:- start:3497 stop:3829 length:333 start_codon:yes stop_codon:yes gene_type:complete
MPVVPRPVRRRDPPGLVHQHDEKMHTVSRRLQGPSGLVDPSGAIRDCGTPELRLIRFRETAERGILSGSNPVGTRPNPERHRVGHGGPCFGAGRRKRVIGIEPTTFSLGS